MSDDTENRPDSDHPRRSVRGAVTSMPGWKKKLLGLALVLAIVGGGSQLASGIAGRTLQKQDTAESPAPTSDGASGQPPAGASGFVARGESPADDPPQEPETIAPPPSQLQRMAPHLTKIGGSFLIAAVLGVIFRTFIKTAAMVTAGAAGLFFLLTYYNVLDIDVAGMKTQYESAAGWASSQAGRLKDVVFAALPSSTSAAAGFFVGVKR